jgi:hypothetical protein
MMCKAGYGAERERGQCFCVPCGVAYDAGPEYQEYVERWLGSDEWSTRGPKSVEDFCTRIRAERLSGGRT